MIRGAEWQTWSWPLASQPGSLENPAEHWLSLEEEQVPKEE